MNNITLIGRLARDPELRVIQGNTEITVTKFSVAVTRKYKAAGEERPRADFLECTAWGKTGEFIDKYFKKGNLIALKGSVETDSYTNKDGVRVYTTDIVVEEQEFAESKNAAGGNEGGYNNGGYNNSGFGGGMPAASGAAEGFMNIPDGIDEELPFN